MLLIACRKVHFKTSKVKCHGKVIIPIFLLLCCLFKPLVLEMIKWPQQGSTILNLPGMYNVRSTLVLGGYVGTGQRSSFYFVINVRDLMPDIFWPCNIVVLIVDLFSKNF